MSGSHERTKVIRLVDYLMHLASLRTKTVREIADYERTLWIADVPHEEGCFAQAWGRCAEFDSDVWVEVQNQREPELPTVPDKCERWVERSTLFNKEERPELLPEITIEVGNPNWTEGGDEPEYIWRTELLQDHPEVQHTWERYVEGKWLSWMEEHNRWKNIQAVYSALFAIHQEQVRLGEEYELVLGLGLLTWKTPSGQRVCRHLIVANALLEFEASLGRFTVRPMPDGADVRPELDMLDIEDRPARAEETAKASLSSIIDNPWDKDCVAGVLRALVHSINSQGEYNDTLKRKEGGASDKPVVEYAPALILRKRSGKGLTEALKKIKDGIEQDGDIPPGLGDIAEIRPQRAHHSGKNSPDWNSEFDGEVFFPKPSNEEQRRIVDKIRAPSGVLVQGPPGTGKSHTIANLICHLLATGQRTLITAKTPRALQVLKELVPDELRPLCINLLGSGLEERQSLESSVRGILRKNEEWNEDHAEQERAELVDRLQKLREEKAKVHRRLRDIRESETHTQTIAEGAYRGTAARIAKMVNRDRADYEWLPDSVPPDGRCPISTKDLQRVLTALRQFTQEKRRELGLIWPEAMLSPECFTTLVRKEKNAVEEEQNSAHEADERITYLVAKNDPPAIKAVRDTFISFQDSRRKLLSISYAWASDALGDILGGSSTMWHELLRVTQNVIASIEKLVAVADETRIEYPDTVDLGLLFRDTRKLKEYMENGGKLGWGIFRPKPVKERLYVIKSTKVNGRPCSTIEHFSNLADALYVRIQLDKAWGFWKGRSEKVEGPYALQVTAIMSLRDALENVLALEQNIAKCREAKNQCPDMGEPLWADESQIKRIIASCRLALGRIRKRLASEEIQGIEAPIARLVESGDAHPVTHDLLGAIRSRDMDRFSHCTNTMQDLEKQRQRLQKVDEYLAKLRRVLPQFTKSLEETSNEPYWEERVLSIGDAWRWAQARYWIEEYIRQDDVPALTKRTKQLEDEINAAIAKLASLHAWSYCFSRLGDDHRRHMEAWQQSMRRLGKGTGKHAPRHRREAQQHLNECREAVPAWVMPLHRIWDTVDPSPGMFDLIIVDEASQCGVEAIPLFYLGKQLLIVGDDKQISPDAVGLPRDAVHRLMEEFLHDFEFKSSFDVESSLFDHGKLRFGTRRITLREHFRCMPEIIRFSNDLCYSDTPLIPLRQYSPDRLPPIEHVFVPGGYREGSNNRVVNKPEADAVVDRICKMCATEQYSDKTIGVIVLQGEAQGALIEKQLLERLGAEQMKKRRIVCGNPYSFQGDERDIMILSMVTAANKRIGPFTKPADERRFNVAASRARDQMILFHSVTCDDLSPRDLRRRLLEFFEGTKTLKVAGIERDELERHAAHDDRAIMKPPTPFESWFEVDVALVLLRRRFIVLPQYEVAGKRIDLVVEGGQTRLAVECDGDRWHGADQYEADMQRQRQLERCGWEFFRVSEAAFYSSKEEALTPLWRMLEERGIVPDIGAVMDKNGVQDKHNGDDNYSEARENGYEQGDRGSASDVGTPNTRSRRHPEEVTSQEISDAIINALKKCPNHSCTLHSLTGRVLKEVGVITRGKPRVRFERRVNRMVNSLCKKDRIEKYKAKNERVRLLQKMA